ncbi:MAG: hypothetical protein A2W80_18120 [Candidatus Riflebacteria bacterium GWC2_50_8]|nr:MAG: hypothetical protein A2W80_18120 [Candidatus Riflebacteria bacterium GWC2_50_8]
MVKKILKLVFVMCLTGSLLYAGEVALVTDISGEVTASWLEPVPDGDENADGERGRHEWQVELAEMLPAGADIKTGEKSSLTLIHLAGNVEYTLGAGAFARVTEEGVEGEAIASTPMQLVSTDINLDGAMQNQVGAVVADQEHRETIANQEAIATQEAYKKMLSRTVNKGIQPKIPDGDSFDSNVERETIQGELKSDDQEMLPVSPQPEAAKLEESSDAAAGASGLAPQTSLAASAVETDAKKKDKSSIIETGFALPEEMLAEVRSANEQLSVASYTIKVITDHEGWVNIRFVAQVMDKDFELLLKGDKGRRTVTMHVERDSRPSIALAWRLEKSGLLAQAASEWLQLQAGGMDAAKVALHLKRIRGKLLAE